MTSQNIIYDSTTHEVMVTATEPSGKNAGLVYLFAQHDKASFTKTAKYM
jgi:hypothetical protein